MTDRALELWHDLFLPWASGERIEPLQKREVLRWAERQFSQARAEAIEEACRAQCEDCAAGTPVYRSKTSFVHLQHYGKCSVCHAKRIRFLMEE